MDIIRKFIPSNPLDANAQSTLKRIIADSMAIFVKNYAKATPVVLVQNKEAQIKYDEKMKAKREKRIAKNTKYLKKKLGDDAIIPEFPEPPQTENPTFDEMQSYCVSNLKLGLKPVFPRVKTKTPTQEIIVKLKQYQIRDSDTDPYAVYIIDAQLGICEVQKKRRFKDFQVFFKKIKSILTPELTIPEPSSKWGKRNLEPDFLKQRRKNLSHFIKGVCKLPGAAENKDILDFLGLLPSEDPIGDQIFARALRRTKWDLWIWRRIDYDKPEEGICQLLMRKVDRELWWDINRALTGTEEMKRAQRKIAYKIINAAINAAVPPAWKPAYAGSKPARETVTKALDGVISIIITQKHEIQNKLTDGLTSALESVKEMLGKVMAPLTKQVVPLTLQPFSAIIKAYQDTFEVKLLEAFNSSNPEKVTEATKILEDARKKVTEDIEKSINVQIGAMVDGVATDITINDLKEFLLPVRQIDNIISSFVDLVNPTRWGRVIEVMLKHKGEIEKMEPTDQQNLINAIQNYEYEALWRADCQSSYMRMAASSLYWRLSNISGVDLGSIPELCYQIGKKMQKKLHYEVMERFIKKFSDNVWGLLYAEGDFRPWKERVDGAFLAAYQSAKKKFSKNLGNIVKKAIFKILAANILTPVKKMADAVLKPIIDTINSALPDNIKEMVDVEEMANNSITSALNSTLSAAIDAQVPFFLEEYSKLS